MKPVPLPERFWLAHPHWVREAESENRGMWRLATEAEWKSLTPQQREWCEAEIASISQAYGAERAPKLWIQIQRQRTNTRQTTTPKKSPQNNTRKRGNFEIAD